MYFLNKYSIEQVRSFSKSRSRRINGPAMAVSRVVI